MGSLNELLLIRDAGVSDLAGIRPSRDVGATALGAARPAIPLGVCSMPSFLGIEKLFLSPDVGVRMARLDVGYD